MASVVGETDLEAALETGNVGLSPILDPNDAVWDVFLLVASVTGEELVTSLTGEVDLCMLSLVGEVGSKCSAVLCGLADTIPPLVADMLLSSESFSAM